MPNKRHKSSIHRFLGILFLSSLTLCLWLGHLPLTTWEAGLGNRVTAQSLNASQLVQQGVDRYQAGEFQRAIEPWQNALKLYQQTNNRANEAIVLENLARAYQQLGQDEQAIHYWEQVTANYRQRENWQQVGRMLTELAQAYSRIGQPRKAIALLCNASQENSDCVSQTALQIVRTYQDRQGEAAAM
ncbi:MAG TPA: tetratricopeptide repeat protein, partial [Coleofasciculaceae cyanobacterium]